VSSGLTLLVADEDQDDRYLTRETLEESRLANQLQFVNDGVELMNYLLRRGRYRDETRFPRPGLLLLNANMPKLDGREALREIRANPELRDLGVVLMVGSPAEAEIHRSLDPEARAFITKPVTLAGLRAALGELGRYWLEIVDEPEEKQ
jgi:CheY-like chemotaxis protein